MFRTCLWKTSDLRVFPVQIENGVSELELLRLELEGLETTLNEKYLLNAEVIRDVCCLVTPRVGMR